MGKVQQIKMSFYNNGTHITQSLVLLQDRNMVKTEFPSASMKLTPFITRN